MPDTLTITDNRTGKQYEVPIEQGAIRAMDLRQIRTSPDDFGLMALALFGFLRGNLPRSVLDGNNTVGLSFAKALPITLFDEDRKRSFPTFLLVVVQ